MTSQRSPDDKPVILVVDDTPQNLSLMCELLEQDYTLKLATSGPRALKIATTGAPPDLILLDIMMPEMDGYEVCRLLKADPATADIPIIFVTALADIENEEKGFALGAVDYITKPVSPSIVRARVRTHIHIKDTRDHLEQRNRDDRERFEQAIGQQVQLNALKSSYLSMATHEFRTPLTSILSAQELLLHSADKIAAEERGEMLHDIGNAVQRMMSMIDDVLEMGRAEVDLHKLVAKPLDLEVLLRHIAGEVTTAYSLRGTSPLSPILLEVAPAATAVVADERLLRHIFSNLLFNAVKYTIDGSEVRVRVTHTDGGIRAEISDHGIGVPGPDLSRLFGTFFRASNVGKIPGTGLGLAIVKRAVETHGGRIEVTSEQSKGSCFVVTLPGIMP